MKIGDTVKVLKACGGPDGAYCESMLRDGKWYDTVVITQKNIITIEGMLRAGFADILIHDDPPKQIEVLDEVTDVLCHSATGTGNDTGNTRTKKRAASRSNVHV